ncbi:MAG: DMT family transporter [Alphaproteobacteria bacterium]|nr:DMT family transporter [Alphaproteobacteria bacterium]
MLLTTLLFASVTGIVRYLGTEIPAAQAAFIRYLIGTIMILPLMYPLLSRPPSKGSMRIFALRGLLHGGGVILWFYAMARIPIAEVTALGYTAPIFVTIGAALFLKETVHFRRVAAVIAGLVGALIILRPGFEEISIGQLAQLGAAPLFAGSFLMAKKLTDGDDPTVIVGMLSVFCTLTLLPFALYHWVTPGWDEIGWLTLTAAFATAGHYTMTRALRAAPITVTQPVTFLQLVWATAMGLTLFGEPLDPFVLLGGGVIIAAATFISHREAMLSRRKMTPPAPATKS